MNARLIFVSAASLLLAVGLGSLLYQSESFNTVNGTASAPSSRPRKEAPVSLPANVSTSEPTALPEPPAVAPEVKALQQQFHTIKALPESAARKNQTVDLLCKLAVKKGDLAMQELFTAEDESFRRQVFGHVLSAWADAEPLAALQWYHDSSHDELAATGYTATPDFHEKCFRQLASQDAKSAATSLPAVAETANRLSAVSAMVGVAREQGHLPAMMDALGSAGELRPVEMALVNKLVGDDIGYGEWRAKVLDQAEVKLLDKELGLDVASRTK